jgi:hypothetical protein
MRNHEAPLPVQIPPVDGELFASWLHRTAVANALSPRELQTLVRKGNWTPQRLPPTELSPTYLAHLAFLTGIERGEIEKRFVYSVHHLQAYGRVRYIVEPSTTRFCPMCWRDDSTPHFRRVWSDDFSVVCSQHRCFLLVQCPCHQPSPGNRIQAMERRIPVHHCSECCTDLRAAPAIFPDNLDFHHDWQRFWHSDDTALPSEFLWRERLNQSPASRSEQREFARFIWQYFRIKEDQSMGLIDSKINYETANFFIALANAMKRIQINPESAFEYLALNLQNQLRKLLKIKDLSYINPYIFSFCQAYCIESKN